MKMRLMISTKRIDMTKLKPIEYWTSVILLTSVLPSFIWKKMKPVKHKR